MGHKIFRLTAIVVLAILVFKVVLQQSSAAPSNEGSTVTNSVSTVEPGLNPGEVMVTRIVYVTATPQPEATKEATETPSEETAELNAAVDPLAIIERSPDMEIAADLQPTFRLVFNRFINDLSVKPYLTVEPEIELSTYWEYGNVLLVRPSVPLEAKKLYRFRISKDMKAMDGSEMASDYSWTFKTRELVKSLTHQMLEDGREVVTLSLNYALDPASLEWTMTPEVPGELSWSESNTILTFTSQNGLLADSRFMIDLGQSLRQQNGMPSPLAKSLSIYTDKLVGFKEPASASENNPYVTLRIPFRRSVDQAVVEAGLTIEPAPRNDLVYEWDENTLLAELFLMPDTYYHVTINERSLVDLQGYPLSGAPIEWGFRTKNMERIVGFGNGPKLQALQVGDEANLPAIDYSFMMDQEPLPVTFELFELELTDWQASPSLADVDFSAEQPVATWEEPAPIYEEERYLHTNQTFLPAGLKPGFYGLVINAYGFPQDSLAVVLTDLGLAFRMQENTMLTWVVDMETMTPVTADVTVYQGTSPIHSGKSDEDGFVSFEVGSLPIGQEGAPLFTVVANEGEQFTVAAVNSFWQTYSVDQEHNQDYIVHLTLDRPAYEVGETAYLRAILRGLDGSVPKILPAGEILTVTLSGWDSTYSNHFESDPVFLTTNDFGVGYGELLIPAEFEPGGYFASVSYRDARNSLTLEVVEPIAEDSSIVTVTTAPIVGQGSQLAVTVEVTDRQGLPLVDQRLAVTLLESVSEGGGCYSSFGRNEWYSTDKFDEQGITDSNGRFSFTVTAEIGYNSHRPYDGSNIEHSIMAVVANVLRDGEAGTGFSVVEVSNVNEELLFVPSNMVQAAGQPFVIEGTVKNLEGEPIARKPVTLSIHEVDANGISLYVEPGRSVSRVNAASNAQGWLAMNVTVDKPGYYQLRMTGQDRFGNEMIAYRSLFVTGSGEAVGVPSLELASGADEYLAGETGQLVILAKEPGMALLTLANQDGIRTQTIKLNGPVTVVDLALSEADAPFLHVQVDMWRGSRGALVVDEYYGEAYSRRDGDLLSRALYIPVMDLDRQLQVSVQELGETNEAGQTAVTVQVLNGRGEPVAAEVALGISSQMLYSHFPNHNSAQYDSLLVRPEITYQLYHSLAPQRDLSYQYFGGCGCGGGWWGNERLPGVVTVKESFWFPGLHTDFNGQATVLVTLTDNPDGWHFSASAITADGQVGEYSG